MEVTNLIFEYFESVCGGLSKIILSVRFSFSIQGNRSVLYILCLSGFF